MGRKIVEIIDRIDEYNANEDSNDSSASLIEIEDPEVSKMRQHKLHS